MNSSNGKPRVAFQGERGAFSEEAAIKLLGERIELVPAPLLDDLFSVAQSGRVDFAVVPLVNTLAGRIPRAHELLAASGLAVVAETEIRIVQNLIACPGARLASVRTVQSHPIAIAQCVKFFANHPGLRPVPSFDTAASVRQVIQSGDLTRAAIASHRAAVVYCGEILAAGIQDSEENFTRFALVAKPG